MTHKLGPGTTTVGVNLPVAERQILGRMAVESDRSISAVIRDMTLAGLRISRPEIADQVEHVRHAHRAAVIGGLALLVIAGFLIASLLIGTEPVQPIICIGE